MDSNDSSIPALVCGHRKNRHCWRRIRWRELIVSFLRKHFPGAWVLLFWLLRGRAHFKRRLAGEAVLRVELLPANPAFARLS